MEMIITIAPDGSVTTKVVGGCGKSCKDATKAIRDALGATVEDKALPEFYEQERAGQQIKGGGR